MVAVVSTCLGTGWSRRLCWERTRGDFSKIWSRGNLIFGRRSLGMMLQSLFPEEWTPGIPWGYWPLCHPCGCGLLIGVLFVCLIPCTSWRSLVRSTWMVRGLCILLWWRLFHSFGWTLWELETVSMRIVVPWEDWLPTGIPTFSWSHGDRTEEPHIGEATDCGEICSIALIVGVGLKPVCGYCRQGLFILPASFVHPSETGDEGFFWMVYCLICRGGRLSWVSTYFWIPFFHWVCSTYA